MNSFIFKGDKDIFETIEAYHHLNGITHLEFNYPEHIEGQDLGKLKQAIGDLQVNGVAVRFRERFTNGEFTNPDAETRRAAIDLCKGAVDACRELGGSVVTVWLAYDGFDYAFQYDYEKAWNNMIEAFREIADYGSDLKISIEYKPFEPRSYSLIDGVGLTLLAIQEIGRDNVGTTLDLCHMLMKHESPAFSLTLAARANRLFGLHMNDGYRNMDSGMIFGSINLAQSLEFVYYLKKYAYDGVVFFDSFPVREDTAREIEANIDTFNKLSDLIDQTGMDRIAEIVGRQDGVAAHRLVLDLLK